MLDVEIFKIAKLGRLSDIICCASYLLGTITPRSGLTPIWRILRLVTCFTLYLCYHLLQCSIMWKR